MRFLFFIFIIYLFIIIIIIFILCFPFPFSLDGVLSNQACTAFISLCCKPCFLH
jgi:hypothetical protein